MPDGIPFGVPKLLWLRPAYAMAYAKDMATVLERRVRLFRNGQNQAVRIPREFELPGKDAVMRKEGERLIVELAPRKSLLEVLATLPLLREGLPKIKDPRPRSVKL